MLHHDFIKCLTTGSWTLRGHTYHFLSPALASAGYFTVDGISDTQLNFEVGFENSRMYLYLNVDREQMPEERYRVLSNYCVDKIALMHELRKDDRSGYGDPTEVAFIKVSEPEKPKTIAWQLGAKLHQIFGRKPAF